jgi:hypothetical protein
MDKETLLDLVYSHDLVDNDSEGVSLRAIAEMLEETPSLAPSAVRDEITQAIALGFDWLIDPPDDEDLSPAGPVD